MKKSYFGLLLAALVTLASCNKEMEGPNGPAAGVEDDGNSVYLSVALNLPTGNSAGTRSSTENGNENTPDGGKPDDGKTPSDAEKDYEVGWDYENEVSSLILVIADKDDNFLLHSVVNALPPMQQNGTDNTLYDVTGTAKFSRNALKKYYDNGTVGGTGEANKEIHLYAFCNYTSALEEYFRSITDGEKTGTYTTTTFTPNGTNSWLNKALALAETANGGVTGSIWGKRSFLMTNAVIAKAKLPESIDKWNNYTSENSPFKLSGSNENNDPDNSQSPDPEKSGYGPIKVERAAARFDFRDGAPTKPATYPLTGKYSVVKEGEVKTNEDVNLFTIQLTDMSLVNMSNGYFALRRVSNDGTQDTGESASSAENRYWRIGKYETASNYVVDTDFEFKKSAKVTASEVNNHFNFPLFDIADKHTRASTDIYAYNRTAWSTTSIQTLLNSKETDRWNDQHNYKIWRYVTENTIPKAQGDNIDPGANQKAGVSTGIVFTGKITAGADINAVYAQNGNINTTQPFVSDAVKELLATPDADKPLYLFNGLLYASFSEIVKAAFNDGPGSRAHNVVSDILKHWYLEYEGENYTPAPAGGKFVYYVNEPSTDGKKYLPLTVEIYYAITQAEHEFEEVLKDGADGNRGANGENVWKAEDTFHNGFVTNKANYKFVIGESEKDTIDEAAIEFVDLAVKNLTIYRATTLDETAPLGYYCYYFYWNRHNDNGNNSLMGNMEFATVRNNVYKLSVTKVGRIGHPTIPTDDPDPIIPDTPDEDDDIYMSVEIEVLPWVVRVNDIEF